jgi:serine protease DegQ
MDGSFLKGLSAEISALTAAASGKLAYIAPEAAEGRTGVLIGETRLLAFAADAEIGEKVPVIFEAGKRETATVAGFDPETGLCLLDLAEKKLADAWKIAEAPPPVGSLVVTVAFPSEAGPEARLDAVRFIGSDENTGTAYFQTDGLAFPGFSGAAVVDTEGRLVGLVASNRHGNGAWIMNAASAADLARRIAEGGRRGRAYLGAATQEIGVSGSLAEAVGDDRRSAVIIVGLDDGGPAEKAGLKVGDVLLAIGETRIESARALWLALSRLEPGSEAEVKAIRGGERKSVRVTLGTRPAAARQGERHGHHGHWGAHHGGCCDR